MNRVIMIFLICLFLIEEAYTQSNLRALLKSSQKIESEYLVFDQFELNSMIENSKPIHIRKSVMNELFYNFKGDYYAITIDKSQDSISFLGSYYSESDEYIWLFLLNEIKTGPINRYNLSVLVYNKQEQLIFNTFFEDNIWDCKKEKFISFWTFKFNQKDNEIVAVLNDTLYSKGYKNRKVQVRYFPEVSSFSQYESNFNIGGIEIKNHESLPNRVITKIDLDKAKLTSIIGYIPTKVFNVKPTYVVRSIHGTDINKDSLKSFFIAKYPIVSDKNRENSHLVILINYFKVNNEDSAIEIIGVEMNNDGVPYHTQQFCRYFYGSKYENYSMNKATFDLFLDKSTNTLTIQYDNGKLKVFKTK